MQKRWNILLKLQPFVRRCLAKNTQTQLLLTIILVNYIITKVIMLTNLEPTSKIINNSIKDQLTFYFVKSDIKLTNLFKKIKELIG